MNSKPSRFPFPLKEDYYRYSNNSTLLDPPVAIEITQEYQEEIELKRRLLAENHSRFYQSLPHTLEAQWEVVRLVLEQLAAYYPEQFQLERDGNDWKFTNRLTKETEQFTFGDPASLPCEPLDFAGRHVQEDLILMGHRDNDLYLDAGQLCFPSNWSIEFNLGMTFVELHTPIPRFTDDGLDLKIRDFIMRIEPGTPWVRRNWGLNAGRRLDATPGTFHIWGQERAKVTEENAGERVYMRVEVQKLFRLPYSYSILFTIHTHLLSLKELSQNREWAVRLLAVLQEIPDFISEYKGFSQYKSSVIHYLTRVVDEARL
jgi:hypothetical protein